MLSVSVQTLESIITPEITQPLFLKRPWLFIMPFYSWDFNVPVGPALTEGLARTRISIAAACLFVLVGNVVHLSADVVPAVISVPRARFRLLVAAR